MQKNNAGVKEATEVGIVADPEMEASKPLRERLTRAFHQSLS